MKLLFDESLSPKLVDLLRDLFPSSESALQNGLARSGDANILAYAAIGDFVLVTTDSDFRQLVQNRGDVSVVILSSCNYPTHVAADLIRRNAIRIGGLRNAKTRLLFLNR
jgi:predicted nuclease of predicted toxin-antitoxin system